MKTVNIKEGTVRELVRHVEYFISDCEEKLDMDNDLLEGEDEDLKTDIKEAVKLLEKVKKETGISENVITYAQVTKNLKKNDCVYA